MIDLPVQKLKPGMVTAQAIYNSSGANYITRGMTLTHQYIKRLKKLGVEGIHVTNSATGIKLLPPEDVLSEKTRAIAVKQVCDVFQRVQQRGTFNIAPLAQVSAAIVNDIINRQQKLVQLTDIRIHDMYTFAHSVNVSMLSSLIGTLAGYDKEVISELALGGMLHDVGKLAVASRILNKHGRLTDEEFSIIRKHPQAGALRIRQLNIPDAAQLAIMAYQHHEKMNGTGYPEGRFGKEIHLYGRICAIADVYDALTSVRPYKKAYTPSVAYHIMTQCSPGQFDEELLQLFFKNVAIYPVGTVLKTSLGYGIVKSVEFGRTEHPIVLIFAEKNGTLRKNPAAVDFGEETDAHINTVINDVELFHLIHEMGFDPASLLAEQSGQ